MGTKALMFSAEFYAVADEDDKKKNETMTAEDVLFSLKVASESGHSMPCLLYTSQTHRLSPAL